VLLQMLQGERRFQSEQPQGERRQLCEQPQSAAHRGKERQAGETLAVVEGVPMARCREYFAAAVNQPMLELTSMMVWRATSGIQLGRTKDGTRAS
jgi:hypothetical protein